MKLHPWNCCLYLWLRGERNLDELLACRGPSKREICLCGRYKVINIYADLKWMIKTTAPVSLSSISRLHPVCVCVDWRRLSVYLHFIKEKIPLENNKKRRRNNKWTEAWSMIPDWKLNTTSEGGRQKECSFLLIPSRWPILFQKNSPALSLTTGHLGSTFWTLRIPPSIKVQFRRGSFFFFLVVVFYNQEEIPFF